MMNEYYDPLGRGPKLMPPPPPPRPLAPPPPTPPGVMSERESGRPIFPDVAFEGSRMMGIAPLPPSSPSGPSPMMYIQQGNNQQNQQLRAVAAGPYRHQHYNQASSSIIRSQPSQKHHIVHQHQHHYEPPQTVTSLSQSHHMLTSSHVPKLSSHHPREYDESYIAPSPMELYQRTRDQEQQQQQNANVQQQNRLYLTSSPINSTYNDLHYSQQHIENMSRRPDGYHADDDRDYDHGRYDYEHQSMGATFPPYQMRNDGIVERSIRSEPSPQIVNYQPQQHQPQYHHRLQVSDNENIYNRNESTLNKGYYENRSPYDGELEQHEYSSTPNDGHGGRVVSSTPQYYSNLQNEYEINDRQQQQQNRNPINDGTTNRRSSEYTMMQQQQQYHFRENVKHEYRDPPPPPISTTPDLYINNDPLSPLSIPWCGDVPVVVDNNNSSGKRSPQDSEAVCLGSFVDCSNCPRYERSDSYNLKGRYGYHPHKYDYHTSTNNGQTNREGVMMQHPYNNNYTNNTMKNQHYHQYDDRDGASIYVVPREVICSKNDDPAPPPPQLLPPPSRKVFERRDDVSGSSTIITPSTFATNPHHQPQNQQQRHRGNIPPPLAVPAVHEQYSTRNHNDHHPLSPIAHNITPQQQQQQQQQHHQWKNTLSHPAATASQQQYSTRNDQSTYNRELYSRSHHARDIPTPNTQNVPNSINNKPPLHIGHHGQHQQKQQQQHQLQYSSSLTVVAAERERRKSKARHQILKEISQATIMRNSSSNDTDRKFWDSQIDTLNQSFKKL